MFELLKYFCRFLCNQWRELEFRKEHLKMGLEIVILFYTLVFLLFDSDGVPVPFEKEAFLEHLSNLEHTRGKEFFEVVNNYKKSLTPMLFNMAPSLTYKDMYYPFMLMVTCWKSFFIANNIRNVTNQRVINSLRYTLFIVFMLMTIETMDDNTMTKYIGFVNFTSLHSFLYNQENSVLNTFIFGTLCATMLPLHLLLDLALIILIINEVFQEPDEDVDSVEVLMKALVFNLSYHFLAYFCINYYFQEFNSIKLFLTVSTVTLSFKHRRTFFCWPWTWKHVYCIFALLAIVYVQVLRVLFGKWKQLF